MTLQIEDQRENRYEKGNNETIVLEYQFDNCKSIHILKDGESRWKFEVNRKNSKHIPKDEYPVDPGNAVSREIL